ncbi:MAG: GAF domain-containing protein [Anaerolineales bacterium]|nr:GAF domain-containing protein [Anaerolineales bacterium]
MDNANTLKELSVSFEEFWDRLAPLVTLAYQAVMLAALIVVGVLAYGWLQQPTLGVLLSPGMVAGNLQSSQQIPQHDFLPQERLTAIDGTDFYNPRELKEILRQYQPGDQVEVKIRARSGHISVRTATLREFSVYERLLFFVVPYITGVVFLAAGGWGVWKRLNDPVARSFALFSASAAFVLGGWFDVWSSQRLVALWLLAVGIAAAALIRYAMLFPSKFKLIDQVPLLSWLGFPLGGMLTLYAVFALNVQNNPFLLSNAWRPLFILGVAAILFYLGTISYRRFYSPSPVDVEQSRILAWGAGIALSMLLINFLARGLHLGFFEIPLLAALIPVGVFPVANVYAITRYRVINTGFLVSRALMYAVLTLLAGGGYALLISGASVLFNTSVGMTNPFVVGGLVFVLALLVNPFRMQIQRMLDTIFMRSGEVFQDYLAEFENQLAQLVELDEISNLLRNFIRQHLEPVRLHIYVHDSMVDRYMPMAGEDGRPTTDIRFPRNSGLAHFLATKNSTLYLDVEEALPPELQNERPRLALLGTQLFVAMLGQDRLTGWLALGPPMTSSRYTSQEISILNRVAEICSAAMERAQVMADKDRRVHEMNVLTRVAQGVNITVEFDDILELLYAQSTQVIPVDNFNITLFDQDTQVLRHAFLVQDDDRLTDQENETIPLGYGLEREVLETRRPLITDDYQQECRNRRLIPNKKGLYAWMGVPLNAGAEVIGVISVGSTNPAILYTSDQMSVLQAVADQAAGAIVKARLLAETQTRARQLASLNEVTRGLTSTLEIDPLLQDIMSSAVEILDCEAGSLLLLDEETQELVFEVVIGPVADQLLGERQQVGVGLAGKVAESMEPLIVNNVEQSPDWDSDPDQETGFMTRGMLVVPMHYKGTVIGVLEVINKVNRSPFTEEDQELLSAFAGQAAVAVENVRLYTQTDQELARRVEELSVMQRIDRELNTSLDTAKAMEITLEWAMRQSNSTAGLVGVIDEEELRVMASQGYQDELSEYLDEMIPLSLSPLSAVIETGGLHHTSASALGESALLENASSQLVIPIRREAEVIGMILLESLQTDPYDETSIDFLTRLSDHASIAISNAQLYSEVQRANLAKSDFVSFVSHELKTPMTSIRGYADLLAAGSVGPVNDAQGEFLSTIRFNIQRMATLVSDLADISRIEAGRLHLDFAPVVMREVVDEVIRSTQALADEKGHTIEIEMPEELPLVWGDRNRLAQILTNLASNAIKYTLEGGTVTIRASREENVWDPEGTPQVLHLQVIDSGIGIKLEDQAKIFQQYFRTDEGKDTASGTGLGLNITRYLVEMQGGKIWFESEFGKGTNFQFTIPLAEVEEEGD